MNNSPSTLKMPPDLAANPLKSILDLVKGGAPSNNGPLPASGDQIAAELAYKLAQASGKASDRDLLKDSVVSLLDALEGLTTALSDRTPSVREGQ